MSNWPVCVSSQIGCGMGCTFCATGGMGFQGNLTAGEILEQVWHVERAAPTLGCHWRVSNVVFMGMGEPLNNYRPVLAALHGLVELWAMPPSRITVSTVGVVGRMRTLAADAPPVHLALSLHAATQPTRLRLVPSAKAYPLHELMRALDGYVYASNRSVLIEFILIAGVNVTDAEAHELGRWLERREVLLNLIPYNPTAEGDKHGFRSPTRDERRGLSPVHLIASPMSIRRTWPSSSTSRFSGLRSR